MFNMEIANGSAISTSLVELHESAPDQCSSNMQANAVFLLGFSFFGLGAVIQPKLFINHISNPASFFRHCVQCLPFRRWIGFPICTLLHFNKLSNRWKLAGIAYGRLHGLHCHSKWIGHYRDCSIRRKTLCFVAFTSCLFICQVSISPGAFFRPRTVALANFFQMLFLVFLVPLCSFVLGNTS